MRAAIEKFAFQMNYIFSINTNWWCFFVWGLFFEPLQDVRAGTRRAKFFFYFRFLSFFFWRNRARAIIMWFKIYIQQHRSVCARLLVPVQNMRKRNKLFGFFLGGCVPAITTQFWWGGCADDENQHSVMCNMSVKIYYNNNSLEISGRATREFIVRRTMQTRARSY